MNINNVASFVNDNLTTIKCKYRTTEGIYTFKCTKEFAATLKVNDWVVAETKSELSLVQVKEIDETSDIDVNKNFVYSWAYTKVDENCLNALKAEESKLVKELKNKQRESLKQQVMSSLLEAPKVDAIPFTEDDNIPEALKSYKVKRDKVSKTYQDIHTEADDLDYL